MAKWLLQNVPKLIDFDWSEFPWQATLPLTDGKTYAFEAANGNFLGRCNQCLMLSSAQIVQAENSKHFHDNIVDAHEEGKQVAPRALFTAEKAGGRFR